MITNNKENHHLSVYEFSSEENIVILSLARRMRAVSLLLGLTGLIAIGNAIPGLLSGGTPAGIGGLIAGAFAILQSIVFFRPTDNLKNIVSSEGEDIAELMQGIGELAGGLKIIVILLGAMAVIIVAAVAISA
jgi:hypothetical protein